MTISQLLRKIKKTKNDVQEYRKRAAQAVTYKEGEEPAFGFQESMSAAETAVLELIALEATLREANARTFVSRGGKEISLSAATICLAELKSEIAWLRTLPAQAQVTRDVSSVEYDSVSHQPYKATTRYICNFTQADVALALKHAQEDFDELNDLVESANHSTHV